MTSTQRKIQSALISVYSKDDLEPLVRRMSELGITLYSTGGTQSYLEKLGIEVIPIEALTGYPSILDGRVKTLHPAVFAGLLARRNDAHREQLQAHNLPEIDCVMVDLYPFEETVATTNDQQEITEKIDIGGVSLIRAAAKNHQDVVVIGSKGEYKMFQKLLDDQDGITTLEQRRDFARRAFKVTSNYDIAIFNWFNDDTTDIAFKHSIHRSDMLRYGENPHQSGVFFGDFDKVFEKLSGKSISYNNLVDIDAAVQIIREFRLGKPTFAILKHTNACGLARRNTLLEAWEAALACDSTSAFGGIFVTNSNIDVPTAHAINKLFYEVLIAPDFEPEALAILQKKDQRILLRLKTFDIRPRTFRSLLNGVVEQDTDLKIETEADLKPVTERMPTAKEVGELLFANKCCKHLKSNAIAIVKERQLIGMGCGQPSRVDALRQAIAKAKSFGFDLKGAVMASDAFFPFPDCVEIAHQEGITAVIQPGGSMRDQDSVEYCNKAGMAMVVTGFRHFRH